jgi:hypothetical protein
MTMRDIQDLTLNIERGLEKIDKIFLQRREKFESWVDNGWVGIRSTAIPMSSDIYFDRVFRKPGITSNEYPSFISVNGKRINLYHVELSSEHPILRGTKSEGNSGNCDKYREVYCNGMMENGEKYNSSESIKPADLMPHEIYIPWLLAIFIQTILDVHCIRVAAGASSIEYGLEIEIFSHKEPIVLRLLIRICARVPVRVSCPNNGRVQ